MRSQQLAAGSDGDAYVADGMLHRQHHRPVNVVSVRYASRGFTMPKQFRLREPRGSNICRLPTRFLGPNHHLRLLCQHYIVKILRTLVLHIPVPQDLPQWHGQSADLHPNDSCACPGTALFFHNGHYLRSVFVLALLSAASPSFFDYHVVGACRLLKPSSALDLIRL